MKLHEDRNAFKVLLSNIHERTGYREDVLEKDYYVMLILEELSKKQQEGLPAYFKGGTALYKALKTTNRFSGFKKLILKQQNITCLYCKRKQRLSYFRNSIIYGSKFCLHRQR